MRFKASIITFILLLTSLNAQNRKEWETTARLSAEWFLNSGILASPDGKAGVYERFILPKNISKHKRPDCNFETALALYLSGKYFKNKKFISISRNIISWILDSNLYDNDPLSETFGLLGWSNLKPYDYWIDDNSWNGAIPLLLWAFGEDNNTLLKKGLFTIFTLLEKPNILGSNRPSPHWYHMPSIPFGVLSIISGYKKTMYALKALILDSKEEKKWTTSEYGYFVLEASIAYKATRDEKIKNLLKDAADFLVKTQLPSGAWPSEWYEGSTGKKIVDLVYTQNWCTLGMLHAYRVLNKKEYKKSLWKSLDLLARIQDKKTGCWRGAWDLEKEKWGGDPKVEGGPSSIYSGWTNAPILLCFIMELSGISFIDLPKQLKLKRVLSFEKEREKIRNEEFCRRKGQALKDGIISFGLKPKYIPRPDFPYLDNHNKNLPSKLTDLKKIISPLMAKRGIAWKKRKTIEIRFDLNSNIKITKIVISFYRGKKGCGFPKIVEIITDNSSYKKFLNGITLKKHLALQINITEAKKTKHIYIKIYPKSEWLILDEISIIK